MYLTDIDGLFVPETYVRRERLFVSLWPESTEPLAIRSELDGDGLESELLPLEERTLQKPVRGCGCPLIFTPCLWKVTSLFAKSAK